MPSGPDSESEKAYWFEPKTMGTGFYPATWQGWLVLVVSVGAMAGAAWFSYWLWKGGAAAAVTTVVAALVIVAIYFRTVDRHKPPGSEL